MSTDTQRMEKKIIGETKMVTLEEFESEFKELINKIDKNNPSLITHHRLMLAVKCGQLDVVNKIFEDAKENINRLETLRKIIQTMNIDHPVALAVAYNQEDILDCLFNIICNRVTDIICCNLWRFPEKLGKNVTTLFELAMLKGHLSMCLHLFDLGKRLAIQGCGGERGFSLDGYAFLKDSIDGALTRAASKKPEFFVPILNHLKTFFPPSDKENFKCFITSIVSAMLSSKLKDEAITAVLPELDELYIDAIIKKLRTLENAVDKSTQARATELVKLLQFHIENQGKSTKTSAVSKSTEANVLKDADGHDNNTASTATTLNLQVTAAEGEVAEDRQTGAAILSQFDQLSLTQSSTPQERIKVKSVSNH